VCLSQCACREALKHGVAINIGGGYHHAQCDKGGGFCVYSDVPIAATILREERLVDRVLIVDTDAHQGNGFAHEAQRQRKTHVLDFFDESIYPFPKVSEDMSVPFPAQTNGQTYLSTLAQMLPEAIARYEPQSYTTLVRTCSPPTRSPPLT
jgi:histone deacetylase 11